MVTRLHSNDENGVRHACTPAQIELISGCFPPSDEGLAPRFPTAASRIAVAGPRSHCDELGCEKVVARMSGAPLPVPLLSCASVKCVASAELLPSTSAPSFVAAVTIAPSPRPPPPTVRRGGNNCSAAAAAAAKSWMSLSSSTTLSNSGRRTGSSAQHRAMSRRKVRGAAVGTGRRMPSRATAEAIRRGARP